MAFTAADVKELREKTGCGMMDCKKGPGRYRRRYGTRLSSSCVKRASAAVAKKASRIAAEGLVVAVVEGNVGVVLEVNAETDFVAKNETFVEMCNNIARDHRQGKPC